MEARFDLKTWQKFKKWYLESRCGNFDTKASKLAALCTLEARTQYLPGGIVTGVPEGMKKIIHDKSQYVVL